MTNVCSPAVQNSFVHEQWIVSMVNCAETTALRRTSHDGMVFVSTHALLSNPFP